MVNGLFIYLWSSSLIIHPNPTNGGFLKIINHVESEAISVNFFYSVPLKSVALPCTLIGSVFENDFVTSHIGPLENTGSLGGADLPSIDTFHYTISQKSHSLIAPTISSRSLLSTGNLRLSLSQVQVFQN